MGGVNYLLFSLLANVGRLIDAVRCDMSPFDATLDRSSCVGSRTAKISPLPCHLRQSPWGEADTGAHLPPLGFACIPDTKKRSFLNVEPEPKPRHRRNPSEVRLSMELFADKNRFVIFIGDVGIRRRGDN